VTEQPPYNILDRRIERELLPMARTYGYGIIPWSPLAGGLLTGKYKRDQTAPEGSRFAEASKRPNLQSRMNEGVFDVTEALEPLVSEKGITLSQFALAWVIHQQGVTSPIIGPRTLQQLEDNLSAVNVVISDADRHLIDEVVPPGRMVSPFYEADFGPHDYRL
jgi:aryl-alcohol dehydrogenase-like predicted oxidoreductase